MVRGREAYRQFVRWGIAAKTENPLEIGKGHGVVGGDDYIEWIKGKFSREGKAEREQPALRKLRREKKPEELIEHYAHIMGKERGELCKRGRNTVDRSMLMEALPAL